MMECVEAEARSNGTFGVATTSIVIDKMLWYSIDYIRQ